jgi:hypothetical protein
MESETEAETPALLPTEQPKVPDPAAVPKKVTTAAAFSGKPPITKDAQDNTANRRQES